MTPHNAADCPQTPLLASFNQAFTRLDAHMVRQAVAMETIAEQGARISSHGERLDRHDAQFDKHEGHIDEAFKRIRKVELAQAEDRGADEVTVRQQVFWAGVKTKVVEQSVPYFVVVMIFFFWLMDKFNVVQGAVKLLKEMKG